jgi:hypothetical protein
MMEQIQARFKEETDQAIILLRNYHKNLMKYDKEKEYNACKIKMLNEI